MRRITVVVLLFLSGCSAGPITSVTVRDAQFKVVKQLTASELAAFERHWSSKVEVKASLEDAGGRHFKLDVERGEKGNRWLYQTSGYVEVLSVLKKPVYRVREPESFNELIGAKR